MATLLGRLRQDPAPVDPHELARPGDYYGDARSDVLPLIPAGARRFLEVGAGHGGFAALLRATRPVEFAAAVEPEPVPLASEHYDRIFRTEYPLSAAKTSQLPPVDCVTFNDVLEHMPDPWAALRQARQTLAPGGTIVASIPNVHNLATLFDLLGRGDWPYSASGVLDVGHLRFFTERSARRLLRSCDLEVEESLLLDPLPLPRPARAAARPLLGWRACGYRRIGFRARSAAAG